MPAAAISACSGNPESTFVILVVIVLNALLGTIQYVKAEKSLESLKDLTSPNAKVLRSGVKVEIPAKEVVPGDLLLLEAGDLVAADGRIRRSYSLQVNESSLTGESTNVEKSEGVIESGGGAWRPREHGVFGKSGDLRKGRGFCDGDCDEHGDR